jgi:hypothetical protein
MHPSHLKQLVEDRQAYLLADRGPRRRSGRASGALLHLTRRGLEKTGIGLIRVGVRLAGPQPSPHRPPAAGMGALKSPS